MAAPVARVMTVKSATIETTSRDRRVQEDGRPIVATVRRSHPGSVGGTAVGVASQSGGTVPVGGPYAASAPSGVEGRAASRVVE